MNLETGKGTGHFASDRLGNIGEFGKDTVEKLEFFSKLFDATFQSFFIDCKGVEALDSLTSLVLSLLTRFLYCDVIELTTATIFFAVLVDIF